MAVKPIVRWLSVKKLKSLQRSSGLFCASACEETGYNKAWIRDNIYEALGLERVNDFKSVLKVYHALFDVLLKHEYKIDYAIKEKPKYSYQYIHARYHPLTFNEFNDEWGNKQNDTIGAFLFKVADLLDKNIPVVRDENDLRILQKLVHYLATIEYWHDKDNGMWEETEEVHASSIGACVAGLKAISSYVDVGADLIKNGEDVLNSLLPHESDTKKTDLALLSLIYPYGVVSDEQKALILYDIETKLVRERGVIRYIGDQYYNKNGEAEWCFGFPWLAKIYRDIGNKNKYTHYMKKSYNVMNRKGELPELYFASSTEHNKNTPLGWAQAMLLSAM